MIKHEIYQALKELEITISTNEIASCFGMSGHVEIKVQLKLGDEIISISEDSFSLSNGNSYE